MTDKELQTYLEKLIDAPYSLSEILEALTNVARSKSSEFGMSHNRQSAWRVVEWQRQIIRFEELAGSPEVRVIDGALGQLID